MRHLLQHDITHLIYRSDTYVQVMNIEHFKNPKTFNFFFFPCPLNPSGLSALTQDNISKEFPPVALQAIYILTNKLQQSKTKTALMSNASGVTIREWKTKVYNGDVILFAVQESGKKKKREGKKLF